MPRSHSLPQAIVALAALLFPQAGRAEGVPEKGEGTIGLLGGARLIPQGGYLNELRSNGFQASHQLLQPQGLISLGFAADEEFHIRIDFGYGTDRVRIDDGDLSAGSFALLLGADTPLVRGKRYTLYGGGGLGYSLNTFSRNGVNTESNSTAGYVAVGLNVQLAGKVAVVIEDRYTVASAAYPLSSNVHPGFRGQPNVGGNFLGVGLLFHFFSPEDAGHPKAPGE